MPELPEVETVVRTLRKLVVNKTIDKVQIYMSKVVKEPNTISDFKNIIHGQKINNISRIGKHIVFELDKNVLISHLRMEGKYYFIKDSNNDSVNPKHVLLTMFFDDGTKLHYHDTRRFGTFHLQDIKTYKKFNPIHKVGPEPWFESCSKDYIYNKLQKKRVFIKSALLDQTIMAGLGNIYVDEVLFNCRIHPETRCNDITSKQVHEIIEQSKKVMEKAIKLGGTTIKSYTSSLGVDGLFQNELNVHQRKGEKCPVCGTIINKIKVGGRGTYFCEVCQPK